jgi:hypothetical protein
VPSSNSGSLKDEAIMLHPLPITSIAVKAWVEAPTTANISLENLLSFLITMEYAKVQSFRYLGSVVIQNNEIKEVKERIIAGDKAVNANKRCFNVNYCNKHQNLDYTGQQSDQLLHTLVKHGY